MKLTCATAACALLLSACAQPGYHYETGSFVATPDDPSLSSADPLVWCHPGGFDQRVPTSVCDAAVRRAPPMPQKTADATNKVIEQCVSRLVAAGYVQGRSGELYAACASGTPPQ